MRITICSALITIYLLRLDTVCGLIEYLVVGDHKGCSDYGFEEITRQSECDAAAAQLQLDCQSSAALPDNTYPRNCYYNLLSSQCTSFISKLYFNAGASTLTKASQGRYPICQKSTTVASDSICSIGLGRVQKGTSAAPADITSFLTCSDTFTFTPYNRAGYLHFALNIKEPGYDWGFQKWKLDVHTATGYETLWSYADYDPYYDAVEGIAIDNTRDVGYTFLSHKWTRTYGTAWERRLMQIDLETGDATVILSDFYPYNCHRLDVSNKFRAVMDIDEANNILYWMGMNQDERLSLYSLDLAATPLQVTTEFTFTGNPYGGEQQSQLHADCNGNLWFTGLLSGVYFYVPGWTQPKLMIDEGNSVFWGGITTIRRENSMEMDWIVAQNFDVRTYDKSGLVSNTYASYPSPPHQQRVGSDGDIMHVLIYDYQNKKMAVNTRANDGDYITFVYDPIPPANPNLVWQYVKGPAEREGMGIRYGNYTYYPPIPNATLLCDDMDLESLKYRWIGGRHIASDSVHCRNETFDTSPCVKIQEKEFIQRRIDTSGLIDVQIRFNMYITGMDAAEGAYFGYDCDGTGVFTEPLSWIAVNGALGPGGEGIVYDLSDPLCWNNNAVMIRFRVDANSNTGAEAAFIDNVCVFGSASVATPQWPSDPLPFCDDLTNHQGTMYWTDYADITQSGSALVESVTCDASDADGCGDLGTCVNSPCVRLHQFGELNLNDFSTKNLYDLYIKFNLCLGCDTSAKMGNTETFEVLYSCDDTYNFNTLRTYTGSLLTASWGGAAFPDQVVDLPSECNNIDHLRISFKLSAPSNDVYLNSFCIKSKTPLPTASPTSPPSVPPSVHPTAYPTKAPTAFPSVNPTSNPSGDPTKSPTTFPSVNPTTSPSTDPSVSPSRVPTANPTRLPTRAPITPGDPTGSPSVHPSVNPTNSPSVQPSVNPTIAPSTVSPSVSPIPATSNPSQTPTTNPSANPSIASTVEVAGESTESVESVPQSATSRNDVAMVLCVILMTLLCF